VWHVEVMRASTCNGGILRVSVFDGVQGFELLSMSLDRMPVHNGELRQVPQEARKQVGTHIVLQQESRLRSTVLNVIRYRCAVGERHLLLLRNSWHYRPIPSRGALPSGELLAIAS
jgi:hypothetical protein